MKKYLVLIGAAIFIMALTTPAAAQLFGEGTIAKSWGHMEIQTVYEPRLDLNTGSASYRLPAASLGATTSVNGVSYGPSGKDITYKQIYQRFRWFLQHGDEKTVRAVIGFEADSSDWGEAKNTTDTNNGGGMGAYAADQVQLEIKWAFLDFVIPNTPVRMMAGILPWNIGGRLFINNDAAGSRVLVDFAPHSIMAGWFRYYDASRIASQQMDMYLAEYKLKQKDWNAYAWGAYRIDQRNYLNDKPYWVGVGGEGKIGNIDLSGQFVYVGGSMEDKTSTTISRDYSAFAAEALGYYNIGPGMKVGAEFYYATGNDANNQTTKINRYPDASAFNTTPGAIGNSESRSIFGNHRSVFMWMNAGELGYQHNKESAYGGYWYGRATFEYSPTPWALLNFNYLYIGDTATGTPGQDSLGNWKQVNSVLNGGTQAKDLSYVGSEINLITYIKIYKGFGYNIGLAYFLPGDIYDRYDASGNKIKSADSVWAFNTRLRYDF